MHHARFGAAAIAMAAGCVSSVAFGQLADKPEARQPHLGAPSRQVQVRPMRVGALLTPREVKINGVSVPFGMSGGGVIDNDQVLWSAIGANAGAGPDDLLGISILDDVTFAAPGNVGSQKLEGVRFSFATGATVSNPLGAINVAMTWFNSMDLTAGATSVASNPNIGISVAFGAPGTGWSPDTVYTVNGFVQWFVEPITVGPSGGMEMAVLDAAGTALSPDFTPALSIDPVTPGTSAQGVWADADGNGFYSDAEGVVLVDANQQPLPTALRAAIELQPVDPNTGACCLAGGSCVALTSADCTSQAGAVFRGAGTKCGATSPTCFAAGVLWDNGPLATGATSASGVAAPTGFQWSEAPFQGNCAFGLAGISANGNLSLRLADDFTVPAGQTWTVNDVSVFAYQTNSVTTVSPFNNATLQIWNGRPDAPGSTIVYGDTTTNRFTSSTFTNLFRTFGSTMVPNNPPAANRGLWRIIMGTSGLTLPAGHYYLDYSIRSSNGGSNFTPLVSVMTNSVGVLDVNNANVIEFDPTQVGGGFDGWFEIGEDGFGLNGQADCLAHAVDTAFIVRGTATGGGSSCYANCDSSTQNPFLNVQDFTCFLGKFSSGAAYANCDNSTQAPVLNVQDFTCFLQKFSAGCSAP